ncbi:MAG: hypothetical protein ACTTJS_00560 [Wolinella sp.]
MNERDELLGELHNYEESAKNLSSESLFLAIFIILVCVAIFAPKIYIRSNIYYTSKNILQLQNQADSLLEENKHLKKQLEDMKFKFLIMDIGF